MNRRVLLAVFCTMLLVSLTIFSVACMEKNVPSPTSSSPSTSVPSALPTTPVQKINLNMGGTSATSSGFAYPTGISAIINKHVSNLNVTVIASGATYDNLSKAANGIFDLASSTTAEGLYEAYAGLDTFKGKANPEVRAMFLQQINVYRLYVTQKSGVTTWSDVNGKKFAPGIPGSGAAQFVLALNDILNATAIIELGNLADQMDALASGAIVGYCKAGTPLRYESTALQVNIQNPLKVLALTEDQVKKLSAVYPYWPFVKTAKGTIKEEPSFEGWERYTIALVFATSKMSQQIGYDITKAVVENWKELIAVYPSAAAAANPLTELISSLPKDAPVPLHAGAVQYAKVRGYNVPAYLIPPEYKP